MLAAPSMRSASHSCSLMPGFGMVAGMVDCDITANNAPIAINAPIAMIYFIIILANLSWFFKLTIKQLLLPAQKFTPHEQVLQTQWQETQ